MHHRMSKAQLQFSLSDRLIRAICNTSICPDGDEDVEELLDAGAEVNLLHGTLLPLHCACMVADDETVKLLIEKGAEVNAIDGYSRAALHYAAERDVYCLETLLKHNADVAICDANDCTALHWAAFKNNVDCIKTLLQYGVDIDSLDFNLNTALSWAAPRGHIESVTLLLDYNADVTIQNYNEETALKRCIAMLSTGLHDENLFKCIDILLKAAGNEDVQLIPNSEEDIDKMERPRSLRHLCRHRIRKSLPKGYLPQLVLELPLPVRLQDFLLLKE